MRASHKAYNEIELTTDVMSASKHRLIQLLLDKCYTHIQLAKAYIGSNEITKKCDSLTKAVDIINYLKICLNFEDKSTVELSNLLDSLYDFIDRKLVLANLKNDLEALRQAENVLVSIKSGWDGIENEVNKVSA